MKEKKEWMIFSKPNEKIFSYVMASTSYIWWEYDNVHFILDQHAWLHFIGETTVHG